MHIYLYILTLFIDGALNNQTLQNAEIPILILINKIDLLPLDNDQIKAVYQSIDYSHFSHKHFLVKDISALKNIHLEDSIRWLFNSMMDYAKNEKDDKDAYINLV